MTKKTPIYGIAAIDCLVSWQADKQKWWVDRLVNRQHPTEQFEQCKTMQEARTDPSNIRAFNWPGKSAKSKMKTDQHILFDEAFFPVRKHYDMYKPASAKLHRHFSNSIKISPNSDLKFYNFEKNCNNNILFKKGCCFEDLRWACFCFSIARNMWLFWCWKFSSPFWLILGQLVLQLDLPHPLSSLFFKKDIHSDRCISREYSSHSEIFQVSFDLPVV